jgi:hypothetical protein
MVAAQGQMHGDSPDIHAESSEGRSRAMSGQRLTLHRRHISSASASTNQATAKQ